MPDTTLRKPSSRAPAGSGLVVSADPLIEAVRRHVALPRGAAKRLKADFEQVLGLQLVLAAQPATGAGKARGGEDSVLSTQQAADLAGVSRPFLVARIDAGEIPLHQRVGNQRRVLRSDVLAWQKREQQRQRQALRQLGEALDDEIFGC